MAYDVIDTQISPEGRLDILSRTEVNKLSDTSKGGLYQVFRSCSLAVLNCGNDLDNGIELLERYPNFEIAIIQRERGIKLDIRNAPAVAFVDGKMIKGIHEHLFAVLRDIVFVADKIIGSPAYDLNTSEGLTDSVFNILRNANVLLPLVNPNMVVCWGGHAISTEEYQYSKEVGYEMGLRALDICTGCGPGAMKGPMKGASVGHAKQHIRNGRYLGITEPGIIAAEAPNPIVNDLVIMPDIEKRLEAFVRTGHGIMVFPGGAGTAEEILYILGILLHPDNAGMPYPLVFTGPASAQDYFIQIDQFIGHTLGPEAQKLYQIVTGNPPEVARIMQEGILQVREFRKHHHDAYYFNWMINIDHEFQRPFEVTHANIRALALHKNQPAHLLAANLRRAFSGVVAGNVKEQGIRAIKEHGNFEIHGDPDIMTHMDALLASFVTQKRMKLAHRHYVPCYRIIK